MHGEVVRTKVLIPQSAKLGHEQALLFFDRLDAAVAEHKRWRPVLRFGDWIGQQWASVRGKPYLENKTKDVKELMQGIGKVVALFQAWEKDKELQKIIEAAEDLDISVVILRANP